MMRDACGELPLRRTSREGRKGCVWVCHACRTVHILYFPRSILDFRFPLWESSDPVGFPAMAVGFDASPVAKAACASVAMKRKMSDDLGAGVSGTRPETPSCAAHLAGLPHLSAEDPSVVEVPGDGLCLYHCAVAARDAKAWALSHSPVTGLAKTACEQLEDRRRAEEFRESVISRLRAAGRAEHADRLGLPGAAGYPGEDEMPFVAGALSGQVILQSGDLQVVHGSPPPGRPFPLRAYASRDGTLCVAPELDAPAWGCR